MSVMMCDKCEKMVDTDFDDFAFMIDNGGQDLCIECWEKEYAGRRVGQDNGRHIKRKTS